MKPFSFGPICLVCLICLSGMFNDLKINQYLLGTKNESASQKTPIQIIIPKKTIILREGRGLGTYHLNSA
jgi:hypothetical protein